MNVLPSDSRPRLARGVRLHEDRVRGGWVLLAPERTLDANPSAVAILKLCDGRSFAALVDDLSERFAVDRPRVEADASALLRDLAAKHMVAL